MFFGLTAFDYFTFDVSRLPRTGLRVVLDVFHAGQVQIINIINPLLFKVLVVPLILMVARILVIPISIIALVVERWTHTFILHNRIARIENHLRSLFGVNAAHDELVCRSDGCSRARISEANLMCVVETADLIVLNITTSDGCGSVRGSFGRRFNCR